MEKIEVFSKYNEMQDIPKYLIKIKKDNSADCDDNYLNIKNNFGDDLPLEKTLAVHDMVIYIISVFDKI